MVKNIINKIMIYRFLVLLILGLLPLSSELYAQDELSQKGENVCKRDSLQDDEDSKYLNAQQYYYEGQLKEAHKDYQEALDLYLKSDSLYAKSATTSHALAHCYLQLGEGKQALLYYEKAYRLDSTDQDYMLDLARLYAQEQKFDKAIDLTTTWLKHNDEDGTTLEYLAKFYTFSGAYQLAIETYDRLQKLNARDFDVCRQILDIKTKIHLALKEENLIEQEYKSLVEQFPDVVEAKDLYLAQTLNLCYHYNGIEKAKQYSKMWKLLQTYEKEKSIPQEMVDRWTYAIYMSTIAFDKALESLDKILTNEQVASSVKIKLLKDFITRSYRSESDAYNDRWERLLAQEPDNSELRLTYGEMLRLQRNFARAIDVVLPLSKSEPENKTVWEDLIGDAVSLEDVELVSKLCLQAIEHIQGDWRNYFYASIGLYSKDKKEEAKAIILKGIKVLEAVEDKDRFGLSMLYGQLGDLYGEMEQEKEQVKAYDEALKLNENNPSVLNNYAYHLSKKEIRLDEAERMAALGVRINGEDANLLDTYAWILYQKKKFGLASLYMTKAIDEGKKKKSISAIMYEHLGYIQLVNDEKAEALKSFEQALEMYQTELSDKSNEDRHKQKAIKKSIRRIKKEIRKLN